MTISDREEHSKHDVSSQLTFLLIRAIWDRLSFVIGDPNPYIFRWVFGFIYFGAGTNQFDLYIFGHFIMFCLTVANDAYFSLSKLIPDIVRLTDEAQLKEQTDENGDLFHWMKNQAELGVPWATVS